MSKKFIPNVDLKGDLDPLIEETAAIANAVITTPVTQVSTTFSSLWNLTFGYIDHINDKENLRRNHVLEMKRLTHEKITNIPVDQIIEPSISVVGPAVESSKYFFEKKHYREMFSNLISSTFDKGKVNSIHPSFVETIKQLTALEATIFKNYVNRSLKVESIPCAKIAVIINNEEKPHSHSNLVLIPKFNKYSDEHVSSALNNLSRLGLLNFTFGKFFSKEQYSYFFQKNSVVQLQTDKLLTVKPNKGFIEITSYGHAFAKVCLSETHQSNHVIL